MYERSRFSSNGHDYRTMNIGPQMRRNPNQRVQPGALFNLLKREKGESGTFMTEFEAIMSECHEPDLSKPLSAGRD
jgi:hypothetical protein